MATIIKKVISSLNAPKPMSPYNQAIVADRTVYVSGCLGLDMKSNQLLEGVDKQAEMALKHMSTVLEAANSNIDKVVKCTIFLKNIADMPTVNELYGKVFCKDAPARSCIQVARLPMDALVEIECIALTGNVVTDNKN